MAGTSNSVATPPRDLLKKDVANLTFSADLNLNQEQVRTIIAAYITENRGKTCLPEDVSFRIVGPSVGEMYEPSTPGYFTATAKIKL